MLSEIIPPDNEADLIEVEYFTDPLCCWSWVFEPIWRKFIDENKTMIRWKYRMGGLISDWKEFADPLNDVSRPAQMAPYWIQVSRYSGMSMDERIWQEDPPQSSYPACIAVKCAEMQSQLAGDIYLQTIREAVMTQCKNIAKWDRLIEAGEEVASRYPAIFNAAQFQTDLTENKGQVLFQADLERAATCKISRFPAIIMRRPGENGLILIGYRPYKSLMETFERIKQKENAGR